MLSAARIAYQMQEPTGWGRF